MKVFNTLSGQKEDFLPQGDVVKMYVCGVTPYDDCHIGHAMSYIIFDVIRRYLQFRGYKVKYVQNITDIDDKIIGRANQLGISARELAGKFTDRYFADMDALNIGRADIYPRATEEIPKIIEVIQGLIDKGYAYPAQGSVYFRVRNVADYGKLSHRSLEAMMATEDAVGVDEKESPADFALWKVAKPGEPSWESPWGQGRPGWHIECSAMSLKYLGDTLDIHGGGQDLVFPHHENEIAQSESFTGAIPFVRYWLHNGLVQLGEDKMSKSLGNLITIKEALERYSADAIRIFILSSHYRSPITYSEEALEAAEGGLQRLVQAASPVVNKYAKDNRKLLEMQGMKVEEIPPADDFRKQFEAAMDDDFNTARAVATLFDLASVINRAANLGYLDKVAEHHALFKDIANVLGLKLEAHNQIVGHVDRDEIDSKDIAEKRGEKLRQLLDTIERTATDPTADIEEIRGYINLVLAVRDSLRKERQFKLADEIRDRLIKCGFTIKDTAWEYEWRYKR